MALSIAPTHVFWTEPNGRTRRYLRCYQSNDKRPELADVVGKSMTQRADEPMPKCVTWCCNAVRLLDEVDEEWSEHEREDGTKFKVRSSYDAKAWPFDAFPVVCEECGKEMTAPTRQIFTDEIYVVKTGPLAGQTFCRRELPVGAMFSVDYYHDIPDWCGRDGLALMVVTPGGEWHVDGKANNCTLPDDHGHRCWVRSGDPRTGYVHIDKDSSVQRTCAAGAGSIWINKDGPRDWHGFLHRGLLCDADDRPKVDAMLDGQRPNPVAPAERVLAVARLDAPRAIDRRRRPMTRAEAVAKQRARNVALGLRANRG